MFDMTVTLRRTPSQEGVRSISYQAIAEAILGKKFELSVVLCGDALARKMNITYRKKTYAPNVLSFPLSNNEGELFLNFRKATREAHSYSIPLRERLMYLYVHGCFHLKGLDHSDEMEKEEARIMKRFL
jgi:probable rRNA maturation factor